MVGAQVTTTEMKVCQCGKSAHPLYDGYCEDCWTDATWRQGGNENKKERGLSTPDIEDFFRSECAARALGIPIPPH